METRLRDAHYSTSAELLYEICGRSLNVWGVISISPAGAGTLNIDTASRPHAQDWLDSSASGSRWLAPLVWKQCQREQFARAYKHLFAGGFMALSPLYLQSPDRSEVSAKHFLLRDYYGV